MIGAASNFMDSADFASAAYNVYSGYVEREYIYAGMTDAHFRTEYVSDFTTTWEVIVNGVVTETLIITITR